MLKISVVGIICLLSFNVKSQTYGVKVGGTLSKVTHMEVDIKGVNDSREYKPGFTLGVIADFEVLNIFSIETGIDFTLKGVNHNFTMPPNPLLQLPESEYKSNLSLYYIDVPIALKYDFDLGSTSLFVKAGSYVGIGLTGKAKNELYGVKYDIDIEWGTNKDEDDYKRLDFGAVFGGGIALGDIQIGAAYKFGLINTIPGTNVYKMRNQTLELSVGYLF